MLAFNLHTVQTYFIFNKQGLCYGTWNFNFSENNGQIDDVNDNIKSRKFFYKKIRVLPKENEEKVFYNVGL